MDWTETELSALRQAYASGTTRVSYDGKTVDYRSVAEIDGVLATMFDQRTLHSKEVVGSLVAGFGDRVFETVIKRSIKFADATVAATPITLFAENHDGAKAYRQLARELICRGGAP